MQSPPAIIWLTTGELADRLRLTTRTLERWRAAQYGPEWHQMGGSIRYSLADVEAFEILSSCGRRA
ncbi:DNA-binding protein [Tabrizicola piscis]|uniref:DNA-binding protein n=2 Tax=Tabrizicola piscis TaxID=2494374 RepID=A0A3S8U2G9_9RHOB|nr:DNA-binding protein [Tabrizicola piscis]